MLGLDILNKIKMENFKKFDLNEKTETTASDSEIKEIYEKYL